MNHSVYPKAVDAGRQVANEMWTAHKSLDAVPRSPQYKDFCEYTDVTEPEQRAFLHAYNNRMQVLAVQNKESR